MPLPVSYTEQTLAEYMHAELREFALGLNWTPTASYAEAVSCAILAYGVFSIDDCTDIAKLRALARVEAWRAAAAAVAGDYTFRDGISTHHRAELLRNALEGLKIALGDAAAYLPGVCIEKRSVKFSQDPYGVRE